MPTYHFVPEPFTSTPEQLLPSSRITAEYGKMDYARFGLFTKAEYHLNGKSSLVIGNCEGSLMLIDTARDISSNPINKLHIRELQIRRPHAESFEQKGEKGVRVDLAEFDTHYAVALLRDLMKWRDRDYREELLKKYQEGKQAYHIPHRVKQLKISEEGLENKIVELEEHIRWLRQPPQRSTRRFVYETSRKLENLSYKAVQLMNFQRTGIEIVRQSHEKEKRLTRKERRKSKIIIDTNIWNIVNEIDQHTREVFDFICPKIDIERARRYWKEIDAWEEK